MPLNIQYMQQKNTKILRTLKAKIVTCYLILIDKIHGGNIKLTWSVSIRYKITVKFYHLSSRKTLKQLLQNVILFPTVFLNYLYFYDEMICQKHLKEWRTSGYVLMHTCLTCSRAACNTCPIIQLLTCKTQGHIQGDFKVSVQFNYEFYLWL